MEYILDAMLQMPSFNSNCTIKEVGEHALNRLMKHDYSSGNFRELENIVRQACRAAIQNERNYLVVDDVKI